MVFFFCGNNLFPFINKSFIQKRWQRKKYLTTVYQLVFSTALLVLFFKQAGVVYDEGS